MNVVLTYGVLTGGGCERRLGDIVRWLLDNGHEAWILANVFDALGETVIHGQCGVPLDRVRYYTNGEGGFKAPTMEAWIVKELKELQADIVDVQWFPGYNQPKYPCPAVATVHGVVGAPPPQIFQGVIAVEERIVESHNYQMGAPVIHNWVNLKRFPFIEELGEGICFVGRAFKAVNARKILSHYDGSIDGYGTSSHPQTDMPSGWRWHGFADPAQVFPRYRVVLGSAQVAMEAMAMGRQVICGQTTHLPNMGTFKPEGCLVTPDNVYSMAVTQFSYRRNFEPSALEVWMDCQNALEHDYLEERRGVRRWIEERHNIDTQIRKIAEYYAEVAGQ